MADGLEHTGTGTMAIEIDETQEKLYNARAETPDYMDFFDRWAARSADLRAACECRLDIPYGTGPRQRLDFFPAIPGAPLVMFIHGGYWQGLDKSLFSFVAGPLTEAGIAVAVIGYDLCPTVRLDHIVDEMRQAAAYLTRNAADLGFEARRLYVSGHSAGGHLTAMLMTGGGPGDATIRGGVAISGLFDLAPLIATSMNAKLGLDAASARRNSPLFMTPAGDAPLLLAVGGDESAGFHEQSDRLADAWGERCRRLDIPGRHHFSVVEGMADPESALFAAIKGMVF